jgi:hypothetical protein
LIDTAGFRILVEQVESLSFRENFPAQVEHQDGSFLTAHFVKLMYF